MNYDPSTNSYEYKCPYEGEKCTLGKHCHVIETPSELKDKLEAYIMCPIKHKKICVVVGA